MRPNSAGLVFEAGFDFVELPCASFLTPDEPSGPSVDFRVETFNQFLRGLTLVGPQPTPRPIVEDYVTTACQRAASVGGEIIVFGSSGARRIPEGFSQANADTQMEAFLHLCADCAAPFGITIAIEPLNRLETNFINTVAEGARWARRINRKEIMLLADTYHMVMEAESLTILPEVADVLVHVHIADDGRRSPGVGSFDYASLAESLRRAHYQGRVAIECGWEDLGAQLAAARAATAPLAEPA